MHVLVVPDSFKGSLRAQEVCSIVAEAFAHAHVRSIPLADGGEGSVDAFLVACGGIRCVDRVEGPYRFGVDACRAVLPDGTAVIELAQSSGLPLVGEDRRVAQATTFGAGQQLLAAVEGGAAKVLLGLGGSSSNDGGCGAAAACGVRFLDARGTSFVPVGETLQRIAAIDVTTLDARVRDASIVVLCDVDNPLTGARGAAAVFAPQKGADASLVALLDDGLAHLAEIIRRDVGVDVEPVSGAGAAGGMGAGAIAFLGGRLERGVDVVLDTVGFEELVAGADVVITGEGSFDSQSLQGKVVDGVAARAKAAGVPVHVLAGRVADGVLDEARALGVVSATAITPVGIPLDQAMAGAGEFLAAAARALAQRLS